MLSTRLKGAGGQGITGLVGTYTGEFNAGEDWDGATNVMGGIDYRSGDLVIVAFTFDSTTSGASFTGNNPTFTSMSDRVGFGLGSYSGYAFLPDSGDYDSWGVSGPTGSDWSDLTVNVAVFRGYSTYVGRTVQGNSTGSPDQPTSASGSIDDLLVHIAHGEDDVVTSDLSSAPSSTTYACGITTGSAGTSSTTAIAYEVADTTSSINRGTWGWNGGSWDDAWYTTTGRFGV